MGNSPHGDKCKVIGPGIEMCSNFISPSPSPYHCIETQDCNADGCAVSCYDSFTNTDGHHVICTGCRNGKVIMENQDMKYNYNLTLTCERNGEEITDPGEFECESNH